jgi:hypothetical protein
MAAVLLSKEKTDVLSSITADDFTFSNGSPEHSVIFVGPSRFNLNDLNALSDLLTNARRALYMEKIRKANEGLSSGVSTSINQDSTSGNEANFTVNVSSVADGIATIDSASYKLFTVLGMTQDIQTGATNSIQPVGKLGSRLKAFITQNSLTQVQGRVSKVLYFGGTLVKTLLANQLYDKYLNGDMQLNDSVITNYAALTEYGTRLSDEYIANLDSDLTKVAFGLGVIKCDRQYRVCGAAYFEGCRMGRLDTQFMTGEPGILENVDFVADSRKNISRKNLKTVFENLG